MNHIKTHRQAYIITILCVLLFTTVLLLQPFDALIHDYWQILISPSILLTDYLAVGGLAATLFNVLQRSYLIIS